MQKFSRSLLAALVSSTALIGTAMANDPAAAGGMDKGAQKCVAADGKELRSADNQPITSKAECDKQGGKLEASPKG